MDTDREIAAKETTDQESAEKNAGENRDNSIRREYGFASDIALKECRYCRVMIPKKAKVCPNCRMDLKRHWFRNLAAAVFAVAVIGVGGYYLSEHWGIMRDAVMSVWMAQDGAAVPAVSVSTAGTVETAAGAAAAGTFGDAVNAGDEGRADPEGTAKKEGNPSGAPLNAPNSTGISEEGTEDERSGGADRANGGREEEQETEEGEENSGQPGKVTEEEAGSRQAAEDTDEEDTAPFAEGADEEDTAPSVEGTDEEDKALSVEDRDEDEATFRGGCTEVDYKLLLRNTESYLETALRVEVQVVCQVNGGLFDESVYYLCKVEEISGIERFYIIRDDREEDDTLILEGDTLIVYGRLFGNCRLPASLMDTRPTVPAVSMLYCDLM